MTNNSIPQPTNSLPQINDLVSELVHLRVSAPEEEATLNALIERLAVIDRRLAFDMECAANCYAAACIDAAFALGWEARANPDWLIFKEEEDRNHG